MSIGNMFRTRASIRTDTRAAIQSSIFGAIGDWNRVAGHDCASFIRRRVDGCRETERVVKSRSRV